MIFRDTITLPPDRTKVLADELDFPISKSVKLEILRDHPASVDEFGSVSHIASEPVRSLCILYIAGRATLFADRAFLKKYFEPESFEVTLYNPTIKAGTYAYGR